MSSDNKAVDTVAKGAMFIFIGIIVSKIASYLYRLIIARIDTETYGLMSLGLAVAAVVTNISILGMTNGVTKFVAEYNAKKDVKRIRGIIFSSLKISLFLSIILSVIFFIFSNQISTIFFHNAKLSLLLKILLISVPFSVLLEIVASILKGFKIVKYETYAKNILQNVLKVALTFALVILGYGVFGAVIGYTVAIIVSMFWIFYLMHKNVFKLEKNAERINLTRKIMKYSLPLALTTFIVMLFQWADTFMIGYFKTASDVGIYNAALPTAKLLYMVPYALTALLLPVISELIAKKDLSSLKTTYQTTTKWIFVMNISIATLFILFSQNILKLLFGAEYIGGAFSLVILSIGYFVFYLALTSESILLSLEKTKLLFYVSFFGSLLNIILNLILIPRYGINGAAIATSISVVLIALLWLIRSYKFVKIMPFRWSYFKILFSVIVSALLVKYLLVKTFDVNNNYILIGGFILFLIVYLVLLIVTRSLEEQDIRILKNIKNNIFNHIGGRL